MEPKQAIIGELPYMRRYARAVIGTQRVSDAVVKSAVEELLTDWERESAAKDQKHWRVILFRAVLDRIGASTDDPARPDGIVANENIVDSHIRDLQARQRQALLLSVLEGFNAAEIAEIMRVEVDHVRRWLTEAQDSLLHQVPSSILIIEDDPLIALDIAGTVQSRGHRVVGIARTRSEAVAMASAHDPELVLADIQLADDSSGIEAADEILNELAIPVIFITAHPEKLLTGHRVEPTFLISKPFNDRLLQVTISQALHARPH